jgi:anion-transporting  ArsA/GET3 family ATPase
MTLNHYKDNILLYEQKISKKNLKILDLKKEIKDLKKNLNNASIKFNLLNNDLSMTSGSFSTPSRINLNGNDNNNSNYFSYCSFNSKNTNTNISKNDNILRNMNKLLGENNFLRMELQKVKNKLYDSNVQIQIYESQEEENLKIKNALQNMNDYINNIINQKILLINFINKQINELNENNDFIKKDTNLKFDSFNICNNYNNIDNFTLNDISVFLKYLFNKIISLCYTIDINKNKECYYIKEIKDNEIEKKLLQEQIYEKEYDIEAYKETIKCYESTIKKMKEEKKI